jgi:uncharacterized protein YciI
MICYRANDCADIFRDEDGVHERGNFDMTRWVAIFEDNPEPEMRSIRKEHAEEHFAYLAKNSNKILLGGGLRNAPGEWYCGGMWVIEVESREDAVALCEHDPFYKRGLRKGYHLYVWGKAPCYRTVEL